jgi:hypothetical protein
MLLGYLAYIVATKDTALATELVNYIHANGNKLCTDASDNRCDVSMPVYSEIWGTMDKIWKYIGLTPDSTMIEGTFGESEILASETVFSGDGVALGAQAEYTVHLTVVEMWIRQHINGWDSNLASAAANVAAGQNLNPFYEYVAHGATQQAAALTITECGGAEPTKFSYWTWQEAQTEQAWLQRGGYDCISMIDILTN